MRFLKKIAVGGAKFAAQNGISLKAGSTDHPFWRRLLIDLLLFPLDTIAAFSAVKCSGSHWSNLFWPRTFSSKIMRRKLFARHKHHIVWADKLAVRDYVASTIGPEYLTELLWSGSSLSTVSKADLPDRFVLKANHASGLNIFVNDKSTFNWADTAETTQGWFSYDHSIGNGEWQYRWIKPCFLIERFLEGPEGASPIDYKFFCFHGVVQFVQVDFDRFTNHTRTLFDRDFRALPFGILYPRHESKSSPPECFLQMISLAEKLACAEPFLRVDFYDVGGKPVFGELTLHPGSGGEPFLPHEWDYKCGKLI